MPSIDLFLAFLATAAVFAFLPGPAMLYTVAQTFAGGRAAGLMASLGIHLGCYVHVIAAAAGLSMLFVAVPTLYLAVKLAGAAYLVWLGIALFRLPPAGEDGLPQVRRKSPRRAFAESVSVEVLNPKTALFFMALLPQFVDPGAAFPVWLQFVILGTIVNSMFSLADVVCVLLASRLVDRLQRSTRMQRLMRWTGGSVLVGLGVHVALQRN